MILTLIPFLLLVIGFIAFFILVIRALMNRIDRNIRIEICLIYMILGSIFLLLVGAIAYWPFILDKLRVLMALLNLKKVYWCLGWAAFGISLGLWNDRENLSGRKGHRLHYFAYFGFVWFIAALAAFVVITASNDNNLHSYSAAALTALVIGFTGDSLAGIVHKLTAK